jgi:hypothetical protein
VIENNSVHDMNSAGIVAVSNQNPSTLNVKIVDNSVIGLGGAEQGIVTQGAAGMVHKNVVNLVGTGIVDTELVPGQPGIMISDNVVADIVSGAGIGISVRESDTAANNKVSNTLIGLYVQSGSGSTAAALSGNTVKNAATAGVEFNCNAAAVARNTISDAPAAYDKMPPATVLVANSLYNTDLIQRGGCR